MSDELMARPSLDKLASSLAKAQSEFPPVPKTGKNPHLKNEYSTLDDIITAIRKPLANHGLAFVQLLGSNGEGTTTLRTILLHESGQSLESTVVVDAGSGNRGVNALQSLGAAITYMKRYSLSAMLGISTDGDADGEGTTTQKTRTRTAQKSEPQSKSPASTGDEGKSKPAAIQSQRWSEAGKKLAAAEPYYQQKDGTPDWYHMTGAAGKLGFQAITDDNLETVIDALRTYAAQQTGQQAEMELEA